MNRTFDVYVPRTKRGVVYKSLEIDLAVKLMRSLESRGFAPFAETTANGITEQLTLRELIAATQ